MESELKFTEEKSSEEEMQVLKSIINIVFDTDISDPSRHRKNVEARMVFSKILRDHRGVTLSSIALFLRFKTHSSIINYIKNFDIYFQNHALEQKYIVCREKFFQGGIIDKLYVEREKLSDIEKKYRRFSRVLDILNERLPIGKEHLLEDRLPKFINGL
jgi:hypothetical protein